MNTEAVEKLIKEYKSMLAHCERELACATSEKMESYYEGKIITYEVVLRDLKKCVGNNASLESAKCNKHGVINL